MIFFADEPKPAAPPTASPPTSPPVAPGPVAPVALDQIVPVAPDPAAEEAAAVESVAAPVADSSAPAPPASPVTTPPAPADFEVPASVEAPAPTPPPISSEPPAEAPTALATEPAAEPTTLSWGDAPASDAPANPAPDLFAGDQPAERAPLAPAPPLAPENAVTPAETDAPVASAPVAAAPVASAPVASAPVAAAPVAAAPAASAPAPPVAAAPVAPVPAAPAPVAPARIEPEPAIVPTNESPAPAPLPPTNPSPEAPSPNGRALAGKSPAAPAPVAANPAGSEAEPAAAPPEPATAPTPAPAPPAEPPPAAETAPAPPAALPHGPGAVIKVIGVGGGGGNAVNRMIEAGVRGVEFIAANTDLQVLERSLAPVKVPLGVDRTGGLGCGGDPEIGRAAARDDMDRLIAALNGADMIFLTVGEGGGTGTGAAPVVACVAQEIRALCVAVVTRPLGVEGRRRRETADDGIRELREYVDTLISVPNDRVVEVFGDLPMRAAFREADDVVRQAVQGISDLIQTPGEINLDFADVRAAMRARGDAVMGIGLASGENRVEEATRAAISSPLLEDTSIRGASSIILNVSGAEDLTLNEISRAAEVVREAVLPEGPALRSGAAEPGDYILLGTALDPSLAEGENGPAIRVTVVATGFPDRSRAGATPQDFFAYTRRAAEPAETPARAVPAGRGAPAVGSAGPSPTPATPLAFPGRTATPAAPGSFRGEAPETAPPLRAAEANRTEAPEDPPAPGAEEIPEEIPEETPAVTPDAPPAFDPAAAGDDRWGDLDTPAWSRNGGDLPGRRPALQAAAWPPNRHDD